MNEINADAPALVRRRRRIARQQRESTPEPIAKIGGIKPRYSDEESSSTTNEYEKRKALLKSKTASGSSGAGSGHNSNTAYREKILSRRDRSHRTSPFIRSLSTPRELPVDGFSGGEDKSNSESGGKKVIKILRQAKRSLSIPR